MRNSTEPKTEPWSTQIYDVQMSSLYLRINRYRCSALHCT